VSTKIPKTASRKKPSSIKKGTGSKLPAKSPGTPGKTKSSATTSPSLLSQLSSINIAKILNGFMTFRSTIKELNTSLQKMENMMDSAYQILAMTSRMMAPGRRGGGRFPLLPPFGRNPGAPTGRRGMLPPFRRNPDPPPGWQTNQSSPFPADPDENIPVIQPPFDENRRSQEAPGIPFAPLLQNMSIGQIMNIIRSPLFQKMMSNLFRSKK
jgi:hypothetical protein